MRFLRFLSVITLLACGLPTAHALHWDIVYRFCPRDIIEIPEIPIPVGCEVVDCCPGCPGPGYIDWRIFVDKTILQSATMRLQGLDQKSLGQLKISGAGKLNEKGEIIMGAGETVVSGLPEMFNGAVPVAYFKTQMIKDIQATAAEETDTGSGLEVRQFRGRFQVNSFRYRYIKFPCPPVLKLDRIVLNNNTSTDSAIVLMDNRTTACNNDQIVRTTGTAFLGNIKSKGACRSTVAVFSDDNAMSYQNNVNTWTDNAGDTHTVNLQPVITVPVSVWATTNALLTAAQNDFANANLLYNQNNTGIQFNPTYTNVTGNNTAINTIGTGCPTAATVGNLQGSAWYTGNRLNIYYVNSAFTGVNCGADRNMNFIGTIANLGSLPHEIGHAYGLRPSGNWGHVNGVAGFGNNNIMWGGGPGTRNWFTVAQTFRLNTDTTSMLNVNGDRTGPTETCLPDVSSAACPVLTLDATPH
ncbi:MAG: hypothetical protein OEZ39_15300 [Gammaproteobacteria bacterium]|nr:hypothetical protein [Gammaproteobacteria bacterium]MDH5653221.1 hypothetical protein [Gammaproteobacteria bacterium]